MPVVIIITAGGGIATDVVLLVVALSILLMEVIKITTRNTHDRDKSSRTVSRNRALYIFGRKMVFFARKNSN